MAAAFVVSGAYAVAVEMRSQRVLTLHPRAWITQPIGGTKVGFSLSMDSVGDLVGSSSASAGCSLIVLVRQTGAVPGADPETSRWSGHHQCGGVPIRIIALLRGLPPHFVSRAAAPSSFNGAAGTVLDGTIHYSLRRVLRASRALLALPTLALAPRTKYVARATARASRAVAWPWRAAALPAGPRNDRWVVALSLFRAREYPVGHAPHAEQRLALEWHDVMFLSAAPPTSPPWRHVLRARLYAAAPSRCSEFLLEPDPLNWSGSPKSTSTAPAGAGGEANRLSRATSGASTTGGGTGGPGRADGAEALAAAERVMRWHGVYYCRGASHDVELAVRSRGADAPVPHRTAVRERDVYVALTATRTAWATARGGARCASPCTPQDDGEEYCSAAAQPGGSAGGAMVRCGEHEALRTLD